jgi:hypothetical protein
MAGFFDPTPKPEHRCVLPPPQPSGGWRCSCGKAYVIESLGPRDTNPGELPYQWRRSPEHDKQTALVERDFA